MAVESKVGVVVGGGLLGLECANALRDLGLETQVVECAAGLKGVQLDDGGSRMLHRKVESRGVQVHTGKNTQRIHASGNCALKMEFADVLAYEFPLTLADGAVALMFPEQGFTAMRLISDRAAQGEPFVWVNGAIADCRWVFGVAEIHDGRHDIW